MVDKVLKEKIKIFLTDQWRSRSKIADVSKQVMLTVADFYNKPERADDYRKGYGLEFRHTMGLDSGGFQILMGKLKGVPTERFCGMDIPLDAQRTIDLYKRTGVEAHDLPIQLDIPPRYDIPPADRRQLIERSAEFYYEMAPEIDGLVPVIHGWTLEEIEYSLRLVEDPDILSAGTNTGARNKWTMGNMNPHKVAVHSTKVAAGVFGAPDKSAVDFVNYHNNPLGIPDSNLKKVAVGTNKGLMSVDYSEYVVSRGSPKRVATPVPGAVDMGWDKPLVDKVISVAVPTKVEAGMSPASNRPSRRKKPVEKKKKKKTVSYNVILDRLVMVADRLVEDYEVFFLGGASQHMTHQIFMLGGKWTDTSAWRIKGLLGEIYLPEVTERHIGYKKEGRKMDDKDRERLRECLRDSNHPYCGLSVPRFLEIGRMLMPEWYETWPKNQWEVKPFELRCYHNAYILKYVEEPIANDLSPDPDAYYTYLRKRLDSDVHPKLVKRLDYLAKRAGFKRSGQTDLQIFMKNKHN